MSAELESVAEGSQEEEAGRCCFGVCGAVVMLLTTTEIFEMRNFEYGLDSAGMMSAQKHH